MKRRLYQLAVILASLFIIQGLSRGLVELSAQDRRIGKAQQELAKLTEREGELQKQLEYFQSDEYVETIARDKLLMAKPDETVLLLPQEIKNSEFIIPCPPVAGAPGACRRENSEFGNPPEDLPNWQKWARLFGW